MRNELKNLMSHHEKEMSKTKKIMLSCPWEQTEFYVNWCGQFYFFVAHATRLLAAAAARLNVDRDVLHLRFLDHCQEEKNHEKLFEKDLEHFGRSVSSFQEHPLAALLYQSQYYLIDYKDPLAFFGSILFLEGMSTAAGGPEIYTILKKKYGDEACNFVKVHVHEDEDHIQKAYMALEKMSDKELGFIFESYRCTSYAFNHLLLDLNAEYTTATKAA